jgi:hypothetical protein
VRYEVAAETRITFHTQSGSRPITDLPEAETVPIEFEGQRFVWHAVPIGDGGEEYWPTITTVISDSDDYAAERLAMERFLSAVAYLLHQPIVVATAAGAGVPEEFDLPVAHALRRGLGDHVHEAPAEVVIVDDDRLRLVLGYYREGLGTASPYFRFLAFWNALDVATEDFAGGLPAWLRTTMPTYAHLRGGDDPPPADWYDHLSDERRHAVAHAVREPGRPHDLDPDDPDAQGRFARDARLFDQLVQIRVRERWGDYAVTQRRRP